MAKESGVSHQTISRIWHAFGLQPHRQEAFTLSADPLFVEKVRDVVGLYQSPPQNAVVFCVDEKSQIQALERSQPILPMDLGRAERHTHDGTVSLFAALDVATGEVLGRCRARHTHKEFLGFLKQIEDRIPPGCKSTPCSTTTPPKRPTRSCAGSRAIPAGTCTSSPPTPPGSIRSNASLPNSPAGASSVKASLAFPSYAPPSTTTSKPTTLPPAFQMDRLRRPHPRQGLSFMQGTSVTGH